MLPGLKESMAKRQLVKNSANTKMKKNTEVMRSAMALPRAENFT
ncbi:hypothetical protein ACVWWG_000018 [Bradyrhizobium sp. LB7.2]